MVEPNNKHKDPIEKLFQKNAREYEISYREEDWLKLKRRLELRDKVRKNGTGNCTAGH